jgi:hypothetical protein
MNNSVLAKGEKVRDEEVCGTLFADILNSEAQRMATYDNYFRSSGNAFYSIA